MEVRVIHARHGVSVGTYHIHVDTVETPGQNAEGAVGGRDGEYAVFG